ncbi:uncharacterized protein LOC130894522 [Diorhabda carinulata]|uniref:uncharacterized protein LOC130894522 n=1 Tax=Diorhabda carinulata TaxID=1163345 RepID=UPI0025A150D8|nr:uncharacterized protein LOC130894522 [Diorhabda carinulata]
MDDLAKAASQKLGGLFKTKKLYILQEFLFSTKPRFVYLQNIARTLHTLKMFDSIQKRAVRLLGDSELSRNLESLEFRTKIADLTLFYRHHYGKCSSEVSNIIPPRAVFARPTRETDVAHDTEAQD